MSTRSDIEHRIVDRYERMADASQRMLAAARADDWDLVCTIEKECGALIAELGAIGDLIPADAALRERKLALLRRVLADDAEIRLLTQPWLRKLDSMMQGSTNVARVNRAYGGRIAAQLIAHASGGAAT